GQKAKPSRRPINNLTMTIEAIRTEELISPFELNFTLDPSINNFQSHTYEFSASTIVRVTIRGTAGRMSTLLLKLVGTQWTPVDITKEINLNRSPAVTSAAFEAAVTSLTKFR